MVFYYGEKFRKLKYYEKETLPIFAVAEKGNTFLYKIYKVFLLNDSSFSHGVW